MQTKNRLTILIQLFISCHRGLISLLGLEVDSWLQGADLICHQWPVSLGTWIGLEMLTERTLVI